MKFESKRTVMTITAIISIIINLLCIISIYYGEIDLENVEVSKGTQIAYLLISIITSIILLMLASKNPVKNKTKITVLNVMLLFFGNIYTLIISIINIVIVRQKTSDLEETNEEKKDLPILEELPQHKWSFYFSIFMILFIILYTPTLDLLPISDILNSLIVLFFYIGQIFILLISILEELKRDLKAFIKNFNLYLSHMLPQAFKIFLIYMFGDLIVSSIVGDISTNQALLNETPILITAILSIIVAPITEELTFRVFIRKLIKDDGLFVIVSSLLFGAVHIVIGDNLLQLLYIIPYSLLGLLFSLNYVKTKNMASNIFLHSMWNTFCMLFIALNSL